MVHIDFKMVHQSYKKTHFVFTRINCQPIVAGDAMYYSVVQTSIDIEYALLPLNFRTPTHSFITQVP